MKEPRLRDSRSSETNELYPINDFPEEVIRRIGRHFFISSVLGETTYLETIGGMFLLMP